MPIMAKENSADISISFLWCPTPYPMRWADRPEDVPEWDTSRGCPLGTYSGHLKEWAVEDAPTEGYPRLVRCSLNELITPRNRANEDVVNEVMVLTRYLEPAREGRQLKNLRNAVQKLAEKYGAPGRYDENTLEGWLRLTYYVNTYMWALHTLLENGEDGFAFLQQDILDRRALIHGRIRAKRLGWADVQLDGHVVRERRTYKGEEAFAALAEMLDHLNALAKSPSFWNVAEDVPDKHDPIESELVALGELLAYADKVEDTVEPAERTAALRLAVAHALYGHFGRNISAYRNSEGLPLHFMPTPDQGIVLWVPLNIWIRFKLAEVWRHGAKVRACPVCGTLFAPTHGNVKYCKRGTCANKQHRLNKTHATQP